jgi:hypothetical protein
MLRCGKARTRSQPPNASEPSLHGLGTATRFAGTIWGWNEKTSRVRSSTNTFNHWTSLLPLAWLSPKVSTRMKFSRRLP